MESLKSISRRIDPRSATPPSESRQAREVFATGLRAFAAAYRHELTDDAIRVYWQALKAIPIHIRGEGMARCVQTQKFFPTVTEILTACADAVDEKRAKAQRLGQALMEDCAQCDPSSRGWQNVLVDGVERTKRCVCWTRKQQLMEEAGAPLTRPALALPAGQDA